MRKSCYLCMLWLGISSVIITLYYASLLTTENICNDRETTVYRTPEDFKGFDNVTGTPNGCYIVPNIVHFIRIGEPEFSFVEAVCVLAALKNQNPEAIYFHTDTLNFTGKYWSVLKSIPGFGKRMVLKNLETTDHIFGQPINKHWVKFHGGDIARLRILMEYGGIYLDNDSYIVRSLNDFRRFEMTLGWRVGGNISNQVIIANKNARFLREWLLTYKGHYNPDSWFYNAGIRPTQEVLLKHPELIHRVPKFLAEFVNIPKMLYLSHSGDWQDHYAIHLLIRHQYLLPRNLSSEATYPVIFDENNIQKYNTNFRAMVFDAYPFNSTYSKSPPN